MSTYPRPDDRPPTPIATGVAPPHSIEAEQSVLGGILLSDRAMYGLVIEEGLKADDFYRERHARVYATMLELYQESEPIDVLTVTERLRSQGALEDIGGQAAVDELTGGVPGLGGIRSYARIVKEHALMRRLLTTTYEIQASVLNNEGAPRELVERAERSMLEVAHDESTKDFRTIDEVLGDELEKMERLSREGTALTGTPSGFQDLDEITGGFQPGNLIIIAARPSMGKSALVTNIAENAAIEYGKPVALFSLEMSETELAQRFVASQARIKGDELRKGRVPDHKWPKIIEASSRLADAPLFIDDSSDVGILEIRAKARRLHQQHKDGLGLIILDYLQLLRPDSGIDSRVEQVGQMSRGLKILARELQVPVIALSQLSRAVESRTDKRPILSDLRECVTGDTLVLLADGRRVPIADLVGSTPEVVAIDDHDRAVPAASDLVWPVGRREVHRLTLASGRALRATAQHRVRTGTGWQTVSELTPGDSVAIARRLPAVSTPTAWPEDRVALLGHLVGGGSYLTGRPLRYTTDSETNSRVVQRAAERGFGCAVRRRAGRGDRHQLVISGNGTRWKPAGVNAWLRELGVWNQRPSEKHLPSEVFGLAETQIACLVRHLWATGGTISSSYAGGRRSTRVSFATVSRRLADDVAALLLRLGIVASIRASRPRAGSVLHTVDVPGADAQRRFLDVVGAFGPKAGPAAQLRLLLSDAAAAPDIDPLPSETRATVRRRMDGRAMTQREMAARRAASAGRTSDLELAPSRATAASSGEVLDGTGPAPAAGSDLLWDRVVSVEPDGEEEVYDLTVPGPACWLADGIVTHNSGQIEQDADLVAFIFREEYYDKESEREGIADIIIAKHRNGGLGDVELTFAKEYPKFMSYTPADRY